MSSSFEHIDDQHVTYRVRRRRKSFMSNTIVVLKGLKEEMSEVLIATSNKCQKMKSWSSDQNNKLAEVVHHALIKCKGKKIEKKNHEEKYDETRVSSSSSMEMKEEEEEEEEEELMLSKDSMLKRLSEFDEKLEKTMETVRVFEELFEELVRTYNTIVEHDEEEQMSDSAGDESESGYCTPA